VCSFKGGILKPNYSVNKRRKEEARRKKQEEKRNRRLNKSKPGGDADAGISPGEAVSPGAMMR